MGNTSTLNNLSMVAEGIDSTICDFLYNGFLSKEDLAERIGTFIGLYQRLNVSGFFTAEHMKIASDRILEVENGSPV